ncbi:hypothetical protein [Reyranella sp.]|uniref:hypothetical protein n=1 Tax=Reyranella sp. TaxID=1929291 RepID=UPI003BADBE16
MTALMVGDVVCSLDQALTSLASMPDSVSASADDILSWGNEPSEERIWLPDEICCQTLYWAVGL